MEALELAAGESDGPWLDAVKFRLSGDAFQVRHRPGHGTRVYGRIAKARHGLIAEFFDRDLAPGVAVVVRPGGRATGMVRVEGNLDPGQVQRIRNFMLQAIG